MTHPTASVYYKVFAALIVLLAATVAIAQVDLGPWNFPAAAAIATGKGLLILLFFMHVRYSPPLTWLFAGAGFFWLGILIGLTYCDYATRPLVDAPPRIQASPSRSTNLPQTASREFSFAAPAPAPRLQAQSSSKQTTKAVQPVSMNDERICRIVERWVQELWGAPDTARTVVTFR